MFTFLCSLLFPSTPVPLSSPSSPRVLSLVSPRDRNDANYSPLEISPRDDEIDQTIPLYLIELRSKHKISQNHSHSNQSGSLPAWKITIILTVIVNLGFILCVITADTGHFQALVECKEAFLGMKIVTATVGGLQLITLFLLACCPKNSSSSPSTSLSSSQSRSPSPHFSSSTEDSS